MSMVTTIARPCLKSKTARPKARTVAIDPETIATPKPMRGSYMLRSFKDACRLAQGGRQNEKKGAEAKKYEVGHESLLDQFYL